MASPQASGGWRTLALLACVLGATILAGTGCAQRYKLTLANGSEIITQGKPRHEGGHYIYRDADGKEERVNEMRVRSIEAQ